jgi:tRNA modification GTPase
MDGATIYALSSAPGKAGVAVVRVSGPDAFISLKALANISDIKPREALFKALHSPDGSLIDRALVLPFKGPASFTGEDVVEYQLHGSSAVLAALMKALASFENHRPADHGEFTRRGFENGKMDLTEAEAIADLINAETDMQREQALSQMGGALYRLYEGWRERLVRAMAYVEAVIDFPDEDVPDSETAKVKPDLESLITDISAHLNDGRRGERLRDGIHIAIVGAPNAGKSSLLNLLAKRDVAIVSPMAGTTRDIIEVHLDLGGYPVILADTAGLRPEEVRAADEATQGAIEYEGIRRALAKAGSADLRILVFDGAGIPDRHTLDLVNENSILLFNKSDAHDFDAAYAVAHGGLSFSAKTGEGLDAFLERLTDKIKTLYAVSRDTPSLTRERHRAALEECVVRLNGALKADLPELMAEDARMAARAIGRITGRVDVEDLLDVIFRDFCIGK